MPPFVRFYFIFSDNVKFSMKWRGGETSVVCTQAITMSWSWWIRSVAKGCGSAGKLPGDDALLFNLAPSAMGRVKYDCGDSDQRRDRPPVSSRTRWSSSRG